MIAHAPILHQRQTWARVFEQFEQRKGSKRVTMVFGEDDDVVAGKEISRELEKIPESRVKFEMRWVPGNYGSPASHSQEVIANQTECWALSHRDS